MPADAYVMDADMKKVADAIRTKGGTTEPLTFPDGMVQAVNDIQAGGDKLDMIVSSKYARVLIGYRCYWQDIMLKSLGNDDYSLDTSELKGYIIPDPYPSNSLVVMKPDDDSEGKVVWEEIDLSDAEVFPSKIHIPVEEIWLDLDVPNENRTPRWRHDAFLVKKGGHTGIVLISWGVGDFLDEPI